MRGWGIAERYRRADGRWHDAPRETIAAILASMGGSEESEPPEHEGPLVVRVGERPAVVQPSVVTMEDGTEVAVEDHLPGDLPPGYHTVTGCRDGHPTDLIVSPGQCVLPEGKAWGWAVQLYAARSQESWGMGDLADLRRLGSWSESHLGAGLTLVNPMHAALPGLPQQASPYFPSSRRFRNPLYLRVEEVPGAEGLEDIGALSEAGRALNSDRRINRDEVYRLKMRAFERLWDGFAGDARFDAYCDVEGESLEGYGTFCALAEEHGRPWDCWPAGLRHPDSPEVAAYRARHQSRVRFHMWLQWLLDCQLAEAASAIPLVHDLAVGVDPAGADAWLWQDSLARDMSVGAPPDEFNTKGQDWGVPPFDPWKLRAAGYRPFVETVRSAFRHAGGIRLDHVMGLFRLYWVPLGTSAAAGTYVQYPASDLLDIVALESARAGAYAVGEDLGTVEEHMREELGDRNVLSYRVLWFEREPPERWPEKALAAVTTHDLPTVAGLWSGSDLEAQRSLDMEPNEEATATTRSHLQAVAGTDDDAPVRHVVEGAYRALARTPCLLLTGTLDDAIGVEERPNMPGTLDEWPNWSIALPQPLEEIEDDEGPARVARVLRRPG